MEDFYIDEKFICAAGIRGFDPVKPCWICNRFSSEMWRTSRLCKFRCRKCSFGADEPKLVDGEPVPFIEHNNLCRRTPGNIFKCPLGMCKREDLSFKDFFSQTCCGDKRNNGEFKDYNDAEKIDDDYLENIVKAHKKLGGLQKEAKEEYDNAKKTFEKAKEKLEKSEERLKNVENKMALYFVRTATAITEGKPIKEDPHSSCEKIDKPNSTGLDWWQK